MIKKFVKHLNYYLLILIIFSAGVLATAFASPDLNLQVLIIIITVVLYVCWGLLHHKLNHELTRKIAIEYLLIGLLGLSIIFFIFLGGM